MAVEIVNESGVAVDEESLLGLARSVLAGLHVHPGAELSVICVDEAAMEQLHLEWMDLPGATDVMSFPMDELRPGTPEAPSPEGLLGDVVICPQVAAVQAARGGHPTSDEILLLLTHGILHLLGFDHEEPEDRAEMFGLQARLLGDYLGRPAPDPTED
ncbi:MULTISPECIES: rRNA maturation RNase YbeY [Micrococcaceae]|uniref:rRNA maturation RNase YbeY n=1 Tax=Micrococcaceae TaxID=1268 RepID=UPI000255F736|nr:MULTISPECIES: rRNA maturation RNase YbeY [Micrococcaceae]MBB5749051.1 putative rRNA maturation factor [Micrococcus sp. TA1]HRO31120.1 rRNA maturation RNase YbeY [Citricoccus sp.]HRO94458.1 rRNA maturation RNase YbeY [Citricoccus sp.]